MMDAKKVKYDALDAMWAFVISFTQQTFLL